MNFSTFGRPVAIRASRRAISVASVPDAVKRTVPADGTSLLHQSAPFDFQLVAGAGVRCPGHLLLHGRDHVVRAVAEQQGPVAGEVVDQFLPVDGPLVRAFGPVDVDRERLQRPQFVRDAAGEHRLGLLEQLPRFREGGDVVIGEGRAGGGRGHG